jgi:hypothetical protein
VTGVPGAREVRGGRFLYHSNYYDGPISGVMETEDGRRYWFDTDAEYRPDQGYSYLLYDLTPEEWKLEDRRHALFREHVGTHCDYDERGRRDHNGVRPRAEWSKFYDDPDLGGYRGRNDRFNYSVREPVAKWNGPQRKAKTS